MTPELRLGEDLALPLEAVTETFAILAKRRAGKSNAAVVLAEEMFAAGLPWVAVDPKGDWWGIRASGDGPGLAVVVFGGLHGDVELEPAAGRLIADLVAERRLTCVLDVSEMSRADQRRFLADFAEQLYRVNREPLHVLAEEADSYIPQRVTAGEARLVGAWEALIKRGGFRGIGVTLISQRSASLNKDVLTQVETLIAMRTPSPQDRKAILAWVEQHEAGRDAVAELPELAAGEAWLFSPQWLGTLRKVRFRRRRTFDSGATPTVGSRPRTVPTRLAEVDLEQIRAALAEGAQPLPKNADPAVLARRVEQLQAQLAAAAAPVVERVEVPVLTDDALGRLDAAAAQLRTLVDAHVEALRVSGETQARAIEAYQAVTAEIQALQAALAAPPRPSPARVVSDLGPSAAVRTTPASAAVAGGEVELRKGARRMVEALGRMAPLRLTRSQWGTVAQLKTSGGTWSTYLSDLRRAGLVDETAEGWTLTAAGFEFLGGRPDPMTPLELQQHYLRILRAGAAKMLTALIDAYPDALSREQLGDAAGLATSGGTFSTYLSDLTRNGLAERVDGGLRATSVLMHGATGR